MKYAFVIAALLAVISAAPANAASKPHSKHPVYCTVQNGITTIIVGDRAVPMPSELVQYYPVKCTVYIRSFARAFETIVGRAMTPDEQFKLHEYQLVDSVYNGNKYDTNGGLVVSGGDANGGLVPVTGNLTATLGSSTLSIGRLNPAVYHQSGAALQSGCGTTCTYTLTVTGLTVLYAIRNVGPAMTGSVVITCYDGANTSGVVILATTQMGGNQVNPYGGNAGGMAITSGSITCAIASSQFLTGSIQLETNV